VYYKISDLKYDDVTIFVQVTSNNLAEMYILLIDTNELVPEASQFKLFGEFKEILTKYNSIWLLWKLVLSS